MCREIQFFFIDRDDVLSSRVYMYSVCDSNVSLGFTQVGEKSGRKIISQGHGKSVNFELGQ